MRVYKSRYFKYNIKTRASATKTITYRVEKTIVIGNISGSITIGSVGTIQGNITLNATT